MTARVGNSADETTDLNACKSKGSNKAWTVSDFTNKRTYHILTLILCCDTFSIYAAQSEILRAVYQRVLEISHLHCICYVRFFSCLTFMLSDC